MTKTGAKIAERTITRPMAWPSRRDLSGCIHSFCSIEKAHFGVPFAIRLAVASAYVSKPNLFSRNKLDVDRSSSSEFDEKAKWPSERVGRTWVGTHIARKCETCERKSLVDSTNRDRDLLWPRDGGDAMRLTLRTLLAYLDDT